MNDLRRVAIRKLVTGVPGLDDVLGGGVPEYSFNLVAGAPGTGKTTLTQQVLFANASAERPGLFFTVLGEPAVKMLRYQQQFRFFDVARVGTDVRFVNLAEEALSADLDLALNRIAAEVERAHPALVVIDSFGTMVRVSDARANDSALQHFVQRLALQLTSWEVTSFLVGEFANGEARDPVFTVADGVIWLMNEVDRNSSVRKLRVTKVRGQSALPGLHAMRITENGVEVFPRQGYSGRRHRAVSDRRLSTGISGLDDMMSGGIPEGDSVLVTGPTGTGKTILATQFVAEGMRHDERALIAVFEEHPETYVARAESLRIDLAGMLARGMLDIMYLHPLDLSVDETMHEIVQRVRRLNASRVVIDSISGFEAALVPSLRQDFTESYYRLMVALTSLGVTILSTVEIEEGSDYLRFSPYNVSFLADDILAVRYVELDGELQRVMSVIKMRGSNHSRELRAYDVTATGLAMREALRDYRGIITGVPERRSER